MSGAGIGTFYGVGLGPGDPELLTRKAGRILSEVDWIFYPFESRTGASFSRRILAALELPATKFRQVSLGMSQDRGPDQHTYATAAEAMVKELRQGKSVAWVTQGIHYSIAPLSISTSRCADVSQTSPLPLCPG